jgi:hypothetical protein
MEAICSSETSVAYQQTTRRHIPGDDTLHNEEFRNLSSSSHVIRMINSRMMRWAGRIARMGEKRIAYRVLLFSLTDSGLWPVPIHNESDTMNLIDSW